jgi:hypothetical protein
MLTKLTIKNFYKRFHTFLICLGIFVFGLIIAALIFIAGVQLVFSLQPNNLIDLVENYFLTSFYIKDVNEILNLSILSRIFDDLLALAGQSAENVSTGLYIVIAISVFVIFISYKLSIMIVGVINKKKLSDKRTKTGAKPLFIKLIIGFVFSIAVTFLMKIWTWSGLFVLLIYLLVDALELILSIHYVYFSNIELKVLFRDKAVPKIMVLYLSWQIIFVIIAVLLGLISPLISFVFAIPFLAYNECNVNYTVITYFKEKIKSK